MIRVSDDIIIKTVARVLVPFIQLYGLYVIMHGHHSPGGGFQGGVIMAASLLLILITFGYSEVKRRFSLRAVTIASSVGILIYGGVGVACMLLGGNFLGYGNLAALLGTSAAQARSLGILAVEIGVAFTVMAVMFSIFHSIATAGERPDAPDSRTDRSR